MEVARATMRRVRQNGEVLAGRLNALGWHALSGAMVSPREPLPLPGQSEAEAITGAPLPMAILAFWEQVGGLDFVWDYNRTEQCPDLFGEVSMFTLDPHCVDPPRLTDHFDMWNHALSEGMDQNAQDFRLELAPDDYHKANISGGSPYGLMLPDASIDPLLVADHFSMRFTSYLRLAFQWGGFPGLVSVPRSEVIDTRVATLTEGLVSF